MDRAAHLDHRKPSGLDQTTKLTGRAKSCRTPGLVAEPAAHTAVHRPQAQSPEFSDDEASTWFEDSGHFRDRMLCIPNKAKDGHRQDIIKTSRRRNHRGVGIEARYDRAASSKVRCKLAIATTNIQERLSGDRAE